MKKFIFENKMVGLYNPDNNTFSKSVKSSIHYCKKYKAWGVDLTAFEDLPDDCKIVFTDTENRKTYTILVSEAKKVGIVDTLQRKSGRQVFIPSVNFIIT